MSLTIQFTQRINLRVLFTVFVLSDSLLQLSCFSYNKVTILQKCQVFRQPGKLGPLYYPNVFFTLMANLLYCFYQFLCTESSAVTGQQYMMSINVQIMHSKFPLYHFNTSQQQLPKAL